ncbi:CHAD domain-containing protein [Bradyrhizobium sp. SSUT112]|uniref:CYTH and CHAD domain-containing protein n=1 Tax=Bradyrhizobium sp. SSUT112 TaxID=3040604 RepID=UPI00244B8E23|nr:CYTH and CHAD domain-containing protein [Bradyrhizobium sp. SSUT112]MDH2355497.1 CHAD domain-containing protein [Bradyrhizobium sp. SSUT112]
MAVETELKFRVPARYLGTVASGRVAGGRVGEQARRDLVSTYFDTRKRKLKQHGLTLRVRRDGDRRLQTVKSANGVQLGRGEWETEITDDAPDLGKARGTPLAPIASKKLRRKLKPVFETSVRRVTLPIRTRRSEIELAVDRGRIVAGHRASPIGELELELKSGRLADLFRVARRIERKSRAELDLRSKSDRGYALAHGKEHPVVFAGAIELKGDMSAGEAFRAIAVATARHFSGNTESVRNGDAEGIHQMRVGLRRLRAAVSLFSKVLSGTKVEVIKSELKWLTGELAPAHEIDVFVKENIEPASRDALLRRGGKAIKQEFCDRRDLAFDRARKAVNSERFRSLLIDTLEWIESDRTIATERAEMPIAEFVSAVLDRRIRKARKDGRHLDRMSPGARHKFRIRAKKIRYATEFFGSLFDGKGERKRLARISKHLKRIQDALGTLNDFIAHREMAVDAALHMPRRNGRAGAFASGVVVGREDRAIRPLLAVAAREARALEGL